MNAPLYNELMAYSQSKLAFHMPGHKFGTIADLNKLNLSSLDNTEVIGMDNLYEASGIIKQAMNLMADFYGAKETIFLTNGSTAGILASILSTCKEGDKLIIARNAHHSVWSGLVLAGVIPIYINPVYLDEEDILGEVTPKVIEEALIQYPEAHHSVWSGLVLAGVIPIYINPVYLDEEDILGEVTPKVIEEALIQYPEAKGVLIVSPTYEGIVSDIGAISEVVHRYDKLLIVDEAHGAHFVLGNSFPISSTRKGADLVINSMHKTLPALTQSGLLHICSNRVKYENVIEALRMIQTSSPSYIMMGLMDYIRCYILEHYALIKRQYIDELILMRERLRRNLQTLRLIEKESLFYDRSKLVISTSYANMNGYQLADILNKHFNIVVEAALDNYIILMTTMADQKLTLNRLEHALQVIDSNIGIVSRKERINLFMKQSISLGTSPREIFYSKKQWLEISECQGKRSTKNIMLYPPGIPLVCIGEEIQEKHVRTLARFKDKLQGIKVIDNKLFVEVTK